MQAMQLLKKIKAGSGTNIITLDMEGKKTNLMRNVFSGNRQSMLIRHTTH